MNFFIARLQYLTFSSKLTQCASKILHWTLRIYFELLRWWFCWQLSRSTKSTCCCALPVHQLFTSGISLQDFLPVSLDSASKKASIVPWAFFLSSFLELPPIEILLSMVSKCHFSFAEFYLGDNFYHFSLPLLKSFRRMIATKFFSTNFGT